MVNRRNSLGRNYGAFREEIIRLYNQGFSANEISGDLKVTVRGINKIVDHYRRYGTVLPFTQCFTQGGSEAHIMTDGLLQCVELWKLEKPSVRLCFINPIKIRLLNRGTISILDFSF